MLTHLKKVYLKERRLILAMTSMSAFCGDGNIRLLPVLVVAVLLLLPIDDVLCEDANNFTLTILHTNDVHARFEEMTSTGAICRNSVNNTCYGGVARRAAIIKRMRERFGPNVLLLDAGDQFQGSLWFYVHRGSAAVHFMNRLKYDAMAIGNHEYDNGVAGLIPFLKNASFPVLCSNVDTTHEPEMKNLIKKSVVLTVGGQKIGIIGFTTKETPILSATGKLIFEDEVVAVQREVDLLHAKNVKKIIALGHAGFVVDKKIAAEVNGVDLVVGGHTNTFFYTGVQPAEEEPEGSYPYVVTQTATGRRVPIVQAFAFGKYLGVLHVTFNSSGELIDWSGNPVLLDKSIEPDSETLNELIPWRSPINEMNSRVIGSTVNILDGRFESCRLVECTMGNVMGDAMVDFYHQEKSAHKDLQIAILNGGSIRASIEPGNITNADIMETLPFGITIDVVELLGSDVLSIFEASVHDYSPCNRHGKFLQVSGVRVTYDVQQPNGKRVKKLLVRQASGEYAPFQPDDVYKVAVSSFLVRGGDGYHIIPGRMRRHYNLGTLDADIMAGYLERHSPLDIKPEGRINFSSKHPTSCQNSKETSGSSRDRAPEKTLLTAIFASYLLNLKYVYL